MEGMHDIRRTLFALRKKSRYKKMQEMRKYRESDYSYKPFDETRSIFVHIPKSAGVSIARALYGNLAGGHASISKYRYVYSKRDFDDYFKFSFVRNPWGRLYSAYRFLEKGGFNLADKEWSDRNLQSVSTFESFVKEWLVSNSIYSKLHFFPQTYFLRESSKSESPLDFIGSFENLGEDFNYISRILGSDAYINHQNKGTGGDCYVDVYDNEMIDIVSELYEEDIDFLNYSFDGVSVNL